MIAFFDLTGRKKSRSDDLNILTCDMVKDAKCDIVENINLENDGVETLLQINSRYYDVNLFNSLTSHLVSVYSMLILLHLTNILMI